MDNIIKEEVKVLNLITEIFIATMLMLFPFVVDGNGFFKILEIKWYAHLIITMTYFALIGSVLIYFTIYKRQNYFKGIRLSKAQIAIILYMIIAIISCFASPYFSKYDLFIGTGRGEGLINTLIYCGTFLAITMFGKFNKRQITYISISSLMFNCICILQYFGFNPFNMYQHGIGTHNVSFIGTIGNLDSVSMILCLYIITSAVSYIFLEQETKYNLLHLLSVISGMFIFQIIDVDSGKVALLFVFAILIPYILFKSEYLKKTIHVISGIVFGFLTDYVVNLKYYYSLDKLRIEFQFGMMAYAMAGCIIILLLLAYCLNKRKYNLLTNRKNIYIIYGLIVLGVIAILLVIYFYDFGISILHDIHELLHGNITDEMGTYRGFLWKRTIKLVKDRPLIGTGPDTFAIRFMSVYKQDVAELGKLTINDTAANVYLTLLINVGFLGFIAYICFAMCIIARLIKILLICDLENAIKGNEKYYIICALTLLGLLVQDCFNLWVVIITPLLFVMFGITHNALEQHNNMKE